MNYKKMIIMVLLMAVLLVSFGMSDSEATVAYPCATGDCEFTFATSFPEHCGPNTFTEQDIGNDAHFDYPYGLIGFIVSGADGLVCADSTPSVTAQRTAKNGVVSGTVTLTFYKSSDDSPLDLTGLVYRKYGPTPDNPTPHWYDFMYDGTTGAVITGNQVVLYFVDGLRGDDDLTVDDAIRDQGGPANGVTAVPTMSEWGMIIFMVLAGLGSLYYLKRQRRI